MRKRKSEPDGMTPAQRRKYEKAMKEIQPGIDKILKTIRDSQIITAKDLSIVINAR